MLTYILKSDLAWATQTQGKKWLFQPILILKANVEADFDGVAYGLVCQTKLGGGGGVDKYKDAFERLTME